MNRRLISYSLVVTLALTLLSIFYWCSDVLGSIVIAAAVTLFFIWLFRIRPAQTAIDFGSDSSECSRVD